MLAQVRYGARQKRLTHRIQRRLQALHAPFITGAQRPANATGIGQPLQLLGSGYFGIVDQGGSALAQIAQVFDPR